MRAPTIAPEACRLSTPLRRRSRSAASATPSGARRSTSACSAGSSRWAWTSVTPVPGRSGSPRAHAGCAIFCAMPKIRPPASASRLPSICHWPELDGCLDHRGRTRQSSRVELVPQPLVDGVARDEQLGQHERVLEALRRALGDRRRAGVRGIPDDDDAAAVPRRRHDVLREPRVVGVRALLEVGADRVPRPAVRARLLEHDARGLLVGDAEAVLRLLDEERVHRVVAGRRVAGDVDRAAVVQLAAHDVGGARHERAPDAHAGRLRLRLDADQLAHGRVEPVGADRAGRTPRRLRRRRSPRRRRRACSSAVTFAPKRTFAPASCACSRRICASAGRGIPIAAG